MKKILILNKTIIQGIYKIGHDSIRLMKCLAFYIKYYYENLNYYDFMTSVLTFLDEVS